MRYEETAAGPGKHAFLDIDMTIAAAGEKARGFGEWVPHGAILSRWIYYLAIHNMTEKSVAERMGVLEQEYYSSTHSFIETVSNLLNMYTTAVQGQDYDKLVEHSREFAPLITLPPDTERLFRTLGKNGYCLHFVTSNPRELAEGLGAYWSKIYGIPIRPGVTSEIETSSDASKNGSGPRRRIGHKWKQRLCSGIEKRMALNVYVEREKLPLRNSMGFCDSIRGDAPWPTLVDYPFFVTSMSGNTGDKTKAELWGFSEFNPDSLQNPGGTHFKNETIEDTPYLTEDGISAAEFSERIIDPADLPAMLEIIADIEPRENVKMEILSRIYGSNGMMESLPKITTNEKEARRRITRMAKDFETSVRPFRETYIWDAERIIGGITHGGEGIGQYAGTVYPFGNENRKYWIDVATSNFFRNRHQLFRNGKKPAFCSESAVSHPYF